MSIKVGVDLMSHFLSPLLRRAPHSVGLRNLRNGHILATKLETAFDSAARRRGLLGREYLPDGAALVIAPCGAVHTFFMRFPIDIVFASRDGRVVKTRSTVPPRRLTGTLRAFAVIELPAGVLERSGTRSGDVLEITGAESPRLANVAVSSGCHQTGLDGIDPARPKPLLGLRIPDVLSNGRRAVSGHSICTVPGCVGENHV
jgi:uncharacterized membrane protein (UPF0127 family)